ncbi:gag-protease polyprotein [Trifolium medium]|uniref:Gag-protease polyprotein n=1 Tax=Trifolium medium TaxID=97028 RepID=A0A392Q389_9FABA|nr:gag-protease polyprotein [Trifolium medium]
MDQGLVEIGYSRKDADIAVVESQDPAPFEIPYQRIEAQIPVKKIDPMVFHVPAPFSFKSTKEVPWNYLPTVSVRGEPIANEKPAIDNIAGIGGMTRSGRIFSPDQPSKNTANEPVSLKEKLWKMVEWKLDNPRRWYLKKRLKNS